MIAITEANKIIAEFMGLEFEDGEIGLRDNCGGVYLEKLYSESLDALVPVWEKLKTDPINIEVHTNPSSVYCSLMNEGVRGNRMTIQQAACIVTAQAILKILK